MSNKSIVIEFVGGGFVLITNPELLEIFVNRHDIKDLKYIIYDGQHIEGNLVVDIKGMISGRIRYV
jgi:hypothetical protein